MTFEDATKMQETLERRVKEAKAALYSIPGVGSGAMGLTPDHVRATAEYKFAKRALDQAFDMLRNFNGNYTKMYAKELRAMRNSRKAR